MSETGDNTRLAHSEGPNHVSEPASPSKAPDPINVSSSAGDVSPSFRSSSAPAPSSMTLDSPQAVRNPANGDSAGQKGCHQQSPPAQVGDSKEPLDEFDWDNLEERFCTKMEECAKSEKALEVEFGEWLQVCFGPQLKVCRSEIVTDGFG